MPKTIDDASVFSLEIHNGGRECLHCKLMEAAGLMKLKESPYHLIPVSYAVCPRPATTVTSDGVVIVSGCGGHLRLCDPLKSSSEGCKVCIRTVTTRTVVTTTTSVVAGGGSLDPPSSPPKENIKRKAMCSSTPQDDKQSPRPFAEAPAAEIPDFVEAPAAEIPDQMGS